MGLRPDLKADLSLLALSALWGGTFVVVKRALVDASPFAFLAVRFGIATLALGLVFRRDAFPIRRDTARAGAWLGLLLGSGFALQTLGLTHTTATRSAFLTGLSVAVVPLLAAMIGRGGLTPGSLAGAAMAVAGLRLVTLPAAGVETGGFGVGEVLTVLCAIIFAAHIVGVDIAARRHEVRSLVFHQITAAFLVCAPLALFAESTRFTLTPALASALLVTGLGGTALAFVVQNAFQPDTTASRAAIIFATEPMFAALTAYVVDGEKPTARFTLGAALIAGAMVAPRIPLGRRRREVSAG
ncbi:MAG: DMT family transporter [Acidobacteria bacterium]|nr:DMT family transporter [Acidobacteriota bacterium]